MPFPCRSYWFDASVGVASGNEGANGVAVVVAAVVVDGIEGPAILLRGIPQIAAGGEEAGVRGEKIPEECDHLVLEEEVGDDTEHVVVEAAFRNRDDCPLTFGVVAVGFEQMVVEDLVRRTFDGAVDSFASSIWGLP